MPAWTPRSIRLVMNLWPPFVGAGIHITSIANDWRAAAVELRARPWNRNLHGTHFGGSLYMMSDPFWLLLLQQVLGRAYVVWDQAGEVLFVRPVHETVTATFVLDDTVLTEIRAQADRGEPAAHWFSVDLRTKTNALVARARKRVHVRRADAG